MPAKEGERAWLVSRIPLEMTDRDLDDGGCDEARVDKVPERVGALSVSQLEPDVRAAEEEAAVFDCRRGSVERWDWTNLAKGIAPRDSDRVGETGEVRKTLDRLVAKRRRLEDPALAEDE